MCGLAASLIGHLPNRGKLRAIVEVFTKNLLANEERGKEATGVAVLNRDGTLFVEKAPIQASEFVRTTSFADFVSRKVTMDAVVLLGHTREPTKGSPSNNHNNHPIVVGNTVGIHNGTITNDDEIFLSRSDGKDKRLSRVGSVDSEAIFALIDEIDLGKPLDEYVCEVKKAAGLLVGSYTTFSCNRSIPQQLLLLKYDKPVSVHYSGELQSLFFSSRYVFLRKAFGKSVVSEALPSKKGYIFDARFLPELGKEPFTAFGL